MMVGTILDVMTAEHEKETADLAHKERHEMADQINQMREQLNRLEGLLKK